MPHCTDVGHLPLPDDHRDGEASPSLSERVARFARIQCGMSMEQSIRVGFSGGADSTALLLLLAETFPRIEAVHLHHGLRGDAADADAAWCEAFCRRRGIPFTRFRLDVRDHRRHGESLEAASRRLRLDYWRATTPAGTVVALGHHADDCLEDLLLRLARGAGSGGLTAMRPRRDLAGVCFVRPLLDERRESLEDFLRARGIRDWRQDESNQDVRFRRNAVRHRWLPLIRETVGHDEGLRRSLEALRDDADCLQAMALASLDAVTDIDRLRTLPAALLTRVLRLWLAEQLGRDLVPPRAAILRLRQSLETFAEKPIVIPIHGTTSVRLDAAGLHLAVPPVFLRERTWSWRRTPILELSETGHCLRADPPTVVATDPAEPEPDTEIFAVDSLAEKLVVRAWQPGDRMIPFGRHSDVKLHDLFRKAKVDRASRCRLPVIISGKTIIWVPGLRRAEFGRVSRGDKSVRLWYGRTDA